MPEKSHIERKYVTLPEVKEMLEKVHQERDLSYEQNLALQHAQKFAKISPEKAREMVEELKGIDVVNEYYATKIVEILPTHPDDVRAIFATDRITLQMNDMEKILEVVRKYI